MNNQKDQLRLAQLIYHCLFQIKIKQFEKRRDQLVKFSTACSEITEESNRYYTAIEKELFGAAQKIQTRLSANMNTFCHKANEFKQAFHCEEAMKFSLSDIYSELSHIEQEFEAFHYDLERKTISVVTEPVVLEDIALGSFEIILKIDEMAKPNGIPPYQIIALNPNPAGSGECVVHPHVSNEQLCEGDGFLPIQKALREGRLLDFFTIVTQILNTYNPDSPYVSLKDWLGYPCYDCGYTVSSQDSYYCESCYEDFCESCSSYCKICDITFCRGCLSECPDCSEPVCKDCCSSCDECGRIVCKDCIDLCVECEKSFCVNCLDENGICHECIEKRKETKDEQENPTTGKTSPSVQSDGMGQARVSA